MTTHVQNGEDQSIKITEKDLPQIFNVKYLGKCEAKGLWGIKHTRTPVDVMVSFAKDQQRTLPMVQLKISKEGISMTGLKTKSDCIYINKNIKTVDSSENVDMKQDLKNSEIQTSTKEQWNKTRSQLTVIGKLGRVTDKQRDFLLHLQNSIFNVKNNRKILKDDGKCEQELCYKTNDIKKDNIHNESKQNLVKNKNQTIISKTESTPEKKRMSDKEEENQKLHKYEGKCTFFGVDTISYGVQDLIYTRVFSIIVVNEVNQSDGNVWHSGPFVCHSFVCDSRQTARKLTYSLAAAFQVYSKSVKVIRQQTSQNYREDKPRKVAIDLRTPEQIASEINAMHVQDSEA